MDVVVIKQHSVDSWSGYAPAIVAVAADKSTAKKWIQDEVDGKHNTGHTYMSGRSADWWIQYGTFSITSYRLQE